MTNRWVRFVKAWQTYSVGNVIEPNGTLRQWLIAAGFVVPVDAPAPPAAIVVKPDVVLPTAKRRGRPPKVMA